MLSGYSVAFLASRQASIAFRQPPSRLVRVQGLVCRGCRLAAADCRADAIWSGCLALPSRDFARRKVFLGRPGGDPFGAKRQPASFCAAPMNHGHCLRRVTA